MYVTPSQWIARISPSIDTTTGYESVYAASTISVNPDIGTSKNTWKPIMIASTVAILDSSGAEPPNSNASSWKTIAPQVLGVDILDGVNEGM